MGYSMGAKMKIVRPFFRVIHMHRFFRGFSFELFGWTVQVWKMKNLCFKDVKHV
jgi:hypothetical protein